jgi:hypothetical protein
MPKATKKQEITDERLKRITGTGKYGISRLQREGYLILESRYAENIPGLIGIGVFRHNCKYEAYSDDFFERNYYQRCDSKELPDDCECNKSASYYVYSIRQQEEPEEEEPEEDFQQQYSFVFRQNTIDVLRTQQELENFLSDLDSDLDEKTLRKNLNEELFECIPYYEKFQGNAFRKQFSVPSEVKFGLIYLCSCHSEEQWVLANHCDICNDCKCPAKLITFVL